MLDNVEQYPCPECNGTGTRYERWLGIGYFGRVKLETTCYLCNGCGVVTEADMGNHNYMTWEDVKGMNEQP